MANSLQQDGNFKPLDVTIIKCWKSDHAIYEIEIISIIKDVRWTVTRRYTEFRKLHNELCKLTLDLKTLEFPPKKPFNNLSSDFLHERKQKLQQYLNAIFERFPLPPEPLANFIDFNIYDIHGITNVLAKSFFDKGDLIICRNIPFTTNILHVFAINDRLKSQSPINLTDDASYDFTHVVDVIGRLTNLKLTGSPTFYKTSNIILNKLPCDLSRFKLQRLEMVNIDIKYLRGLDKIKQSLVQLKLSHSLDHINNLALADLLAFGNGDWVFGGDTVATEPWLSLTTLDLSHNFLCEIDASIALFNKVENLNLSHNLLTSVQHLDQLVRLKQLNLSHNKLGETYNQLQILPVQEQQLQTDSEQAPIVIDPVIPQLQLNMLRCRLGNITVLNLSNNSIKNTSIINGLYSLVKLNMSNNCISELSDLDSLGNLPCLENLMLLGNAVCKQRGYRRYTLQLFGDRFSNIILDLCQADGIEYMKLRAATENIGASANLKCFASCTEVDKDESPTRLQNQIGEAEEHKAEDPDANDSTDYYIHIAATDGNIQLNEDPPTTQEEPPQYSYNSLDKRLVMTSSSSPSSHVSQIQELDISTTENNIITLE